MGIWDFVQDEILGMKWLNRLIGSVLNACGLDTSGKIGGSVRNVIKLRKSKIVTGNKDPVTIFMNIM